MQKTKKRIIGVGGLVAVMAMTAYAATIPVPDAGATSAASSGQVKISVSVFGDETWTKITSIQDGEAIKDGNITIGNTYTAANKIEYILYKKLDNGERIYVDLGENAVYIPETTPESGNRSFDFNLDSIPELGRGRYVLKVIAYGYSGDFEDTVTFKYGEDEPEPVPDIPKTGNILNKLNLSKTDLTISGLIVFGLATFFALRVIKKRNRK